MQSCEQGFDWQASLYTCNSTQLVGYSKYLRISENCLNEISAKYIVLVNTRDFVKDVLEQLKVFRGQVKQIELLELALIFLVLPLADPTQVK